MISPSTDQFIYLDIGHNTVKTTQLLTDSKYLLDASINNPKIFSFPRFAVRRIKVAETEEDMINSVECELMHLYNNTKPQDPYPEFLGSKLKRKDRFHIMRLMYNFMNNQTRRASDSYPFKPLVLTEKLNSSVKKRARNIEYAFEEMHVPALYLVSTPSLIQMSEYRDTGVVVELAESTTNIICIKDGFPLRNFLGTFPKTGFDITRELVMRTKNIDFDDQDLTPYQRAQAFLIRDGTMKGNGFFKEVTQKDIDEAVNEVYFSGSGRTLADEICSTVSDVTEKIGYDPAMFGNLVIGGGISQIGGADNKLIAGLSTKRDKAIMKLTPRRATNKHLASIVGARILACVPNLKDIMPTRSTYYECGADHIASRII